MTIDERRVGDVTILALGGRLIWSDGDDLFRKRVDELVAAGRVKLVINLRDARYVDSAGVGVIVSKYLTVRRRGGDMKFLHLSEQSHRVMHIAGLLSVFDSFDSEEAAVASFARGS
jgi:anti-sigma B factor antagonist